MIPSVRLVLTLAGCLLATITEAQTVVSVNSNDVFSLAIPLPKEAVAASAMRVRAGDVGVSCGIQGQTPVDTAVAALRRFAVSSAPKFTVKLVLSQSAGGLLDAATLNRLRSLPNADQAYLVRPLANNAGLLLVANSAVGLLFATRTLEQLVNAPKSVSADTQLQIPLATVTDWPDLRDRSQCWFFEKYPEAPEEYSKWKFNELECGSVTQMVNGVKKVVLASTASQQDAAHQHGIRFVPIMGHINNWMDLAGEGHCFSNPKTVDFLAKGFVDLGKLPDVTDVSIWLSEVGPYCTCSLCKGKNEWLLETAAVVKAYQRAKATCPNLGLRILTTRPSAPVNDQIVAMVPPETGLYYYGFTYCPNRQPLITSVMADYAASGHWLGIYLGIAHSLNAGFPWTGPQYPRARANEFVAKKMSNVVGRLWPPNVKFNYVNMVALAEFSWNAKGRTCEQFAYAYARRTGIPNPSQYAKWVLPAGEAGWSFADTELMMYAVADHYWGPSIPLTASGFATYFGGKSRHDRPVAAWIWNPENYATALAQANEALSLARQSGYAPMIGESKATLAGIEAFGAIRTALGLLGTTDAAKRQQLSNAMDVLRRAADTIHTELLAWQSRVGVGGGPKLEYASTALQEYYQQLKNKAGTLPPPQPVPEAPYGLTATAGSPVQVSLSWSHNSSDESGFKIERRVSGGSFSPIGTTGKGVTTYTDSTVTPATAYRYQVRAYNANGNSPYSNVAFVDTPGGGTTPAAPSGLGATALSSSRINLAWTDNSTNETGFKIDRRQSGTSDWVRIAAPAANTSAYADTGLPAETKFYYQVKAYNASGNSPYSALAYATTASALQPPAAPSALNATPVSATRIDLSWTDNSSNEDGFKIDRRTSGTQTWVRIATPAANARTYADTGLSPATHYYYKIKATNAAGDSPESGLAPATTPADPVIEKVPAGASWRYRKGTAEPSEPAPAWRGVGFDDSGWPSGPAPFGYSSDPAEGPFGTTLTDMRNSYTCLFLRNAFVVDNPARVSELQLAGVCDDGFILWVNGEEAARVNVAGAPGTPAPYDALAASSTEPTAWSATLTGSALPALRATNIVAVQVFNGSLGSSDLVFDLRMIAQQGSALPPAEDADFDGMHDDWETAHLSGLSDPSDRSASGDPDGDGLSNLEEYIAGTDPRAKPADAAPGEGGFMVDVQLVGEQVDVSFPTLAASGTSYAGMTRHYALESCAGAGGMDWLVVSGYEDIAGAGQTVTYTAPPSAQPALYRARVWLAKEREPPPPPADRPAVIGFTHPADGASVSGSFTVTAEAYDPDVGTADGAGILKVVFELRTGTTLVASRQENNATYIWPLDTTAYANGAYLLRAIATSTAAAGGGSASAEIGITIDNAAPPPGDYTLYKTWGQVYAGVGARYATVKRISDPGTSSNPNYTGFWFYGTLQFDPTGRYSLGMQVHFQNRDVRATDSADIGVIDLQNGNRWTPIGTSTAWNWQQGNRLQWRPHSDEILWNDRSDDGTHYVCRVYNFKTGARRTLPRPIYGVSADGRYALTQDFERMTHGGTNYVGIPDPYAGQKAPAGTGFWRMDLDSGAATLILSLQEFAALAGYTGSANIYAFRSESNYSGSRWRCVVKADGAAGWGFIMNGDGGDVRFPTVPPSGAHTTWLDNDTVISGELKTWEDENGGTPKTLVTGVPDNDPAMVMGTTYPDWVALDTYPLSNGYQYLTLFHLPTQTFVPLARLKNAAPSGVYRVDLHVRSSRDGRTLSFDSSHEGSGRQLYLVDIGYILDNPPQG